jgi:hypothetical protein
VLADSTGMADVAEDSAQGGPGLRRRGLHIVLFELGEMSETGVRVKKTGELIGLFGVIASLIFVGLEIRQTAAARGRPQLRRSRTPSGTSTSLWRVTRT